MADWSTWDGLNDLEDEAQETVVFGVKDDAKPGMSKPSGPKLGASKPPAAKPERQKGASRPVAVIAKKKAARGAGLMKVEGSSPVKKSPAKQPSDSPFILDSRNPFSLLMDETEREEAALAEEKAAAERKLAAQVAQQNKASIINAVIGTIKESSLLKTNSPVARRTRAAAKFLSKGVVAVADSVVAALSPRKASKSNVPMRSSRLRPVA